jgi:hypothetical protein
MVLVGYFSFKLVGIEKIGLFSSCESENYYSVELFHPDQQELRPVGEKHLAHLPLVMLDKGTSFINMKNFILQQLQYYFPCSLY